MGDATVGDATVVTDGAMPVQMPVLIVDDDAAIRETIHFLLEDEGYAVLEARDGVAGLDTLRRTPDPMVVLTKHNMPRLDGPGLVSFVVDDSALARRTAFIYTTAANRAIPPAFRRQLEALHARILRKPFDIHELLASVAEAADRLHPHPHDEPGDGASHSVAC
jgi:CheY-like chemotaxis protein